MMTKLYYERTTLFAHTWKSLLFSKCIINQKQCRTYVEGGVSFFTGNGCIVYVGSGGALVQSEKCQRLMEAFQVWDGAFISSAK